MQGCYNVYQYDFMKFHDIANEFHVKAHDGTVSTDMANFYTSIFNSASATGQDCVVDVSSLTCYAEDDVILKGNRFVNVEYHNFSDSNAFNFSADDTTQKKETDKQLPDTNTVPDTVAVPYVTLSCIQTNTTSMDNLSADIINSNVVITDKSDSTKVYNFNFKTFENLKNGLTQQIPFGIYNVKVDSKYLDFDTNIADITISKGNTSFVLNYEYDGLNTNLTVSLAGTDDSIEGSISILLTNKADTSIQYSFVFVLTTTSITRVVPYAAYTYQIVASDGYVFDNLIGDIELTVQSSKEFTFNYVKSQAKQFHCDINHDTTWDCDFQVIFDFNALDFIKSVLPADYTFVVVFKKTHDDSSPALEFKYDDLSALTSGQWHKELNSSFFEYGDYNFQYYFLDNSGTSYLLNTISFIWTQRSNTYAHFSIY